MRHVLPDNDDGLVRAGSSPAMRVAQAGQRMPPEKCIARNRLDREEGLPEGLMRNFCYAARPVKV